MRRFRLGVLACMIVALMALASTATAQTITPTSIAVSSSSPVCTGGSQSFPVSITLPPSTISDSVDVFLLFDDTGSFASVAPSIQALFPTVMSNLEAALPTVQFGFGVGRFEDFGGPGTGFSTETITGRPFTLNQPIVTSATAGGTVARDALISGALARTAPGFGGDGPETAIEALYQLASGVGFDGDGNGSTLDSGAAGAVPTQTLPGVSGDVPAFSSNVATSSGTLGGGGFRAGSLRVVLVATDIASVSPFTAGSPIPGTITGTGGSEPSSAFDSGFGRFGFVSDSKTLAGNTVIGAIAPSGSGTVQAAVSALNGLGLKVIGLSTGGGPSTSPGPSGNPSVFLSALARMTGSVDAGGNALVFPTSTSGSTIAAAIQNAITAAATAPIDITLGNTALPAGLSFAFTPATVNDVAPGGTASFTVTLTGNGSAINGSFDIQFKDAGSGGVLGSIPVTITCAAPDTTKPACDLTGAGTNASGKKFIQVTTSDSGSGLASIVATKSTNANTVVPAFTVGTKSPVVVTATKINQSQSSVIELRVTDVAGNVTVCDPVLTVVLRENGEASQTHSGLPAAESKITVVNDTPGVRHMDFTVNGVKFRLRNMGDGATYTLDVASAMKPGSENTIVIDAKGKKGGSALVVISD